MFFEKSSPFFSQILHDYKQPEILHLMQLKIPRPEVRDAGKKVLWELVELLLFQLNP